MNLKYFYWYFNNAFSEEFIDRVVKTGLAAEKQIAITGTQSKLGRKRDLKKQPLSALEKKQLKKVRNSTICWLSEQYMFDAVTPYIRAANKKAGWNFQFAWTEDAQFTIYTKGMHYDWHMDSWDGVYPADSFPNFVGKIRKLSSIILLSDPKDFKGGELELDFTNGGGEGKHIATEINQKGSLIVFPSFVKHRLKPVTKGIRYSMPMWHLGRPWQ